MGTITRNNTERSDSYNTRHSKCWELQGCCSGAASPRAALARPRGGWQTPRRCQQGSLWVLSEEDCLVSCSARCSPAALFTRTSSASTRPRDPYPREEEISWAESRLWEDDQVRGQPFLT